MTRAEFGSLGAGDVIRNIKTGDTFTVTGWMESGTVLHMRSPAQNPYVALRFQHDAYERA